VVVSDGVQFVVGSVLKCDQGVVSTGDGQEYLVELALSRALVASLRVLDDENHRQRDGGHHRLEDGFPLGWESRALPCWPAG
jgi:hypothetical protein